MNVSSRVLVFLINNSHAKLLFVRYTSFSNNKDFKIAGLLISLLLLFTTIFWIFVLILDVGVIIRTIAKIHNGIILQVIYEFLTLGGIVFTQLFWLFSWAKISNSNNVVPLKLFLSLYFLAIPINYWFTVKAFGGQPDFGEDSLYLVVNLLHCVLGYALMKRR